MNATPRPAADLIIVDRRPGDYAKLIHDAEASLLDVYFFSSGEAALRATCAASSTVWMINTRLPDVAGVDLLQEISRRSRKSVVYLVGDAYSPQEELAARTAGATFYVCKPASIAWLRGYHPRPRSPAIRAGPAYCPAAEPT